MAKPGTVEINVEKVANLIQAKGLKKMFIAEAGGINKGTLRKALRRGYARVTTVRAIAVALGVRTEDIAA